MFVDKAKIKVKGGDGGDGCCSFRREKFVPRGGPDGGDGGGGGDVVFVTDLGERSLVVYRYNQYFAAKRGTHGKGKDLHGKRAKDLELKVPPGTVVRERGGEILADLDEEGARFVVAKGGRGGRGNPRFANNGNRAPMEREEGLPGEEFELELELKTISDVGLVGFPNAGKSTLLRAISHAHPKVASYPFTTLNPVVGIMETGDFDRITVADIPGLVKGAHDGVGLGHSFLRHIERAGTLVFVLDMAGVDGRDPLEDLECLAEELELHMKGLAARASLVVANKMDLPEAEENLERLRGVADAKGLEVVPVSAANGDNIDELRRSFARIVERVGEERGK
jgi:GTP-binding protein